MTLPLGKIEGRTGSSGRTAAVTVTEVTLAADFREFINLPWELYRGNPYWVPPLLSEIVPALKGQNNPLFDKGPHALLLARRAGLPAGRLLVGINDSLNEEKGFREGYLALFESVDDYAVAAALFDTASSWFRERGMEWMRGPLPHNDDDYRGLLVCGFDSPPTIMNQYHPRFYQDFFERYGFEKYLDYYAYHVDLKTGIPERFNRVVDYAKQRYGYDVQRLDLKNLESEMADVKRIVDVAMPAEWPDFTVPTLEEVRSIGHKLRPVAVADLCYIARSSSGEPIGFSVALPDYNVALKRLNGRLFPLGWLKFLWYRRQIRSARLFVLFVVPAWRKRGVTAAIYLASMQAAARLRYTHAEGSTILETNMPMRRDVERMGAVHSKTYRIYQKRV